MGIRMQDLALTTFGILLASAGCASAPQRVANKELAHLPEAERATIEQKHAKELAAAQEEERRTAQEIAEARKAVEQQMEEQRAASKATKSARAERDAASGDSLRLERAGHEVRVAEEAERIEAAKASWLEARLRFRTRLHDAGVLHLRVVQAKLELAKAEAID